MPGFRQYKFAAYVLVAALINCFNSQAQESKAPVHKEQTVVTGTYAPIPLDEADRTIHSIAIDQSPSVFRNAMSALQSLPAVDLRQRSPGVQGDLSIRGSSFGQTLVLVNGLRLNDAQTAHNNLDLPFPFAAVQRIEVLEGSGSTLYGADALGGAVNFITAVPETTELRLAATGGSFGTNGQNGALSYVRGAVAEQITFTRELSTGFAPNRDYRSLAFGSETTLKTGLGLTDLLLGYSDRPFGAEGFYGNYPSWERIKGWLVGVSQPIGANTTASFAYRRHTDLYNLYRYRPLAYENRHSNDSWQASLRRKNEIASNTRIYYGLEGYRDSIDSTNLGQRTRDRGAVYAGIDLRTFRRFSFNAGMREEYFTGGRTVFSPSVSGGYWLNSHVKFHGAVSNAFRLPTFTDLYYSDPSTRGNPNLLPERAWSYEGGVQLTVGRMLANVTVFRRNDRNAIDYTRFGANDLWRAANIQNLQFTGVTASVQMQVTSAHRIDVAYAGLRGSQDSLMPGQQSRYVFQYPVHSGTISWWAEGPRQINARLRVGVLDRYSQDPYPLVELTASRRFGRVKPFIQLSNIANAGFEEIPGVRMPRRAYLGGIEFFVFGSNRNH